MSIKVRVSGAWKDAAPFVKVGEAWKPAMPYTRVGGVWKRLFPDIIVGTVGTYVSATDATSYTATGLPAIAANQRAVVVLLSRNNSPHNLTAPATIGGNAMAPLHSYLNSAGTVRVAFYLGSVGQTGNVAVTYDSALLRFGCALWPVQNIMTPAAFATGGSDINPMSASIDCLEGGAIFGASFVQPSATSTWANLTKGFDLQIGAEPGQISGASDVFLNAQTGRSITCTAGGTPGNLAMALVSLR